MKHFNMVNIYFRLDVDKGIKYGIGHFFRSIQLYSKLKELNCTFLVNDIFFFKKLLKTYSIKYPKKIIKFNITNFKKNYQPKTKNIFIFDTLGRDKKFKAFIKHLNYSNKIVSLEDRNIYTKYNDIVINSKIYLLNKKTKKKNIFSDIKYTILRFKKKIGYKKLLRKKKYKILICSGGADYKKLLFKVASILLKFKNIEINCIVGPSVKKNDQIYGLSKKSSKIKLITKTYKLEKNFRENDIVITSGGTMMIESIFFSKPTYVVETFKHQKSIVEFFKKKKLIHFLGTVEEIDKKKIKNFVDNLNLKNKEINKMTKNSYNVIDGKGLIRVYKIIKKLI